MNQPTVSDTIWRVTHLFCASLGGENVWQPSDVGDGIDNVSSLTADDCCQLLQGRGEFNLALAQKSPLSTTTYHLSNKTFEQQNNKNNSYLNTSLPSMTLFNKVYTDFYERIQGVYT